MWGDMEGGGLSGNGSGTRCARAWGVRAMYGEGSSGCSTGSPWNVGVFCCFFLFSEWLATNTLLCPCTFVQNFAHGSRVCAIRSQECVYGN